MMTMPELLTLLDSAYPDLETCQFGSVVQVIVIDFLSFDENWNEEFRDLENPALVVAIKARLEEEAESVENDFYTIYHFPDFIVRWGYASYDI